MTIAEAAALAIGPAALVVLAGRGLRDVPTRRLMLLAALWCVLIGLAWMTATLGLVNGTHILHNTYYRD